MKFFSDHFAHGYNGGVSTLRKKLSVGQDIVHYCNTCKLDLGHTIVAMVGSEPARVRCNTCRAERNFRKKKVIGEKKTASRETRRKTSSDLPSLYHQKLKDSLMRTPKNYRVDLEVETGDVIQHSRFGKGIVMKTIPPDRMEILFPDEIKVLACKAAN